MQESAAQQAIASAWAAFERDEYAQAERSFGALLTLPTLSAEEHRQARFGLGYALAFLQQHDAAREHFRALQDEAAAQGDRAFEHVALHQVGMVERMAGAWEAALASFEEERHLIAALGEGDLAVAVNAHELGTVLGQLGRQDEAKTWLDRSLERARRTTDRVAVGCAQRALGDWHAEQGQEVAARRCWEAAQGTFLEAGSDRAAAEIEPRLSRST